MNDRKFIELLNLYLDREISPADAAWLEEEILRDPQRRKLYRQYCQMHRACALVSGHFLASVPRATLPSTGSLAGKFAEFAPRPSRVRWRVYAAGFAAAACVALVAIRTSAPPGMSRQSVPSARTVAMEDSPPVAVAGALPKPSAALVANSRQANSRPVLAERFRAVPSETVEAEIPAVMVVQAADLLPPLPAAPVNAEEFAVEPRPTFTPVVNRGFRGRGLMGEATVEMTSFQFQR